MTPLAPVVTPAWRSNLPVLLEFSFQILVLLCFIRVAAYVARKIRAGQLIDNGNGPIRFEIPGWAGALFAINVLILILLQAAIYMILVVIGVGLFLLYSQRTAEEQFALNKFSAGALLKWSLLVCGAVIFVEMPFAQLVETAMNAIHLPHPRQESVEDFRKIAQPSIAAAFMLQAVLISPLIEELFFRGFLFAFLKNYTTTWPALILSAGVFAFVHVNLGSVLPLWLLGIVLGIAYEHTGSLLLPIGIHACFNLVTALSLLLDKSNGAG